MADSNEVQARADSKSVRLFALCANAKRKRSFTQPGTTATTTRTAHKITTVKLLNRETFVRLMCVHVAAIGFLLSFFLHLKLIN